MITKRMVEAGYTRQQAGVTLATVDSRSLRSSLVTILFVGILLTAAVLRIANLVGPDFNVDEINHIFAAKQLIAGNPPTLPSGQSYTRELTYTKIVAYTGWFLGINERTARLPSTVFGLLSVIIVFIIARKWYSSFAALVAAFLTALSPLEIAFSRHVRLYAMFQFLYLTFIFCLFQGFETSSQTINNSWVPEEIRRRFRALEINPVYLVVAGIVLFVTVKDFRLMIPALSGPTMYVVLMAIIAICYSGISPSLRLKYIGSSCFVMVAIIGLYFTYDNLAREYLAYIAYVPIWAEGSEHNWRYYKDTLSVGYPVVFGTFGLAGIYALTRNPKATLYLVSCFTLTLLLHSFLFAWKMERYIFHVVPLMFIVFSVGFSALVVSLYRTLVSWGVRSIGPLLSHALAGGLTVLATLFLLSSVPWFIQGIKLHSLTSGKLGWIHYSSWKSAMRFISEHAGPADIVITSVPLLAKYYGPDLPLFLLDHGENRLITNDNLRDSDDRLIEYTAGARVITDLQSLQRIVAENPSGWVVTERFRLNSPYFLSSDIQLFLEKEFAQEEIPSATDMIVWRWKPREKPPNES